MTSGRRRSKECGHCGALDSEDNRLSRCLGCYDMLYCSETCQKAAWKKHRRRCRRASKRENTLLLEDDQNPDFDASLTYASKYKPNVKHVEIVINYDDDETDETKGVVLTAETLQTFLELNRGRLESVYWEMDDPEVSSAGEKTNEGQVWTCLHGLKVLRMKLPVFSKSRDLFALIRQQESTICSLALIDMALGHDMNADSWSRQDCKLLSAAIGRCVNLVRLDLSYNFLRDGDLDAFLPCLPDLRVLLLPGLIGKAYLTDRSCKLIAKTCPRLQELDLGFHRKISVPGVKRVLRGCQDLRMLQASIRLQPNDIKSLLCFAPNLLVLHTEFRFDETIFLDAVRETGGRLVLDYFDNKTLDGKFGAENVFCIKGLPAEIQQAYQRSKDVCDEVDKDHAEATVINEWERALAEYGLD
ncbi:hypothetical protein ACHAXT_002257 [Thalassiosira profunda]